MIKITKKPVSPQQVFQLRVQAEADSLIDLINEKLSDKDLKLSKEAIIPVDGIEDYVVAKVTSLFESAGWTIKPIFMQRDKKHLAIRFDPYKESQ